MRRELSIAVLAGMLLAGCSSGTTSANGPTGGGSPTTSGSPTAGDSPATTGSPVASAAPSSPGGGGGAADASCSGGLTGTEPGVQSVTCDGSAEIRIQAGDVTKDLHGGTCQSAAGVWSATVGVLIDETGLHGTYKGPPVSGITVNDTADGKGTIQADLDGKDYFALGTAKLTLSPDKKTAHIEGTSDPNSGAPGAKLVVDVTC